MQDGTDLHRRLAGARHARQVAGAAAAALALTGCGGGDERQRPAEPASPAGAPTATTARAEPATPEAATGEAGCTLRTYRAQPALHVEKPPKGFEYNSEPPTTGPHRPTPLPFGVYAEPVDQTRLVHNLEHGGVAIQYGFGVAEADVNALLAWYRASPNGIVVAPRPQLGPRIALTAWNAEEPATSEDPVTGRGIVVTCPRFDASALDAFMAQYAFRGPERVAPEALAPSR